MIKTRFAPSPTGRMHLGGLAAGFSLDHLGRAPARFDASQLDHWQRETISRSTPADLWAWMSPLVAERVPEKITWLWAERQVALPAAARGAHRRIDGPDLADLIALMPRERVRERFAALLKKP